MTDTDVQKYSTEDGTFMCDPNCQVCKKIIADGNGIKAASYFLSRAVEGRYNTVHTKTYHELFTPLRNEDGVAESVLIGSERYEQLLPFNRSAVGTMIGKVHCY